MIHNLLLWAGLAIVSFVFTGCFGPKKEEEFNDWMAGNGAAIFLITLFLLAALCPWWKD